MAESHIHPANGANGTHDLPINSKSASINGSNGFKNGSASRLTALAQTIARETERVDAYLKDHPELGYPTFDADGPADFPTLPPDLQKSRLNIIEATTELKSLVVGPTESLRWAAWSFNDNLSLRAVNQFHIANAFPVGLTATFEEISDKIGVDLLNTKRLIRHAMIDRVFKEVSPNVVAHTAASKALAQTPSLQDWLGFCLEDIWPSSARTIDAMLEFPGSQELTETGFNVAWDTVHKEPMFVTFGKDPVRGRRFGGAMKSLTGGEGYEVQYLVDNYPWAEIDQHGGTLVDMGGSHGFVCVDLAKKFKNMKFVVQDLPKMIASAPKLDGDLGQRISFMGHDFYTPQPVKAADVYFFRWIFHNASDKYALTILKQLIPALNKGSKVVINDHCLPDLGQESLWDEKLYRTMDLVMLTLLNAQDRTKDEFEALFKQADSRYRLMGVTKPKGCRMSIVEAVWEGEDFGGISTEGPDPVYISATV